MITPTRQQTLKAMNDLIKRFPNKKIIIINQPTGLGDILFTIPIARKLKQQGVVVYPYDEKYGDIGKHFKDLVFVERNKLNIDYEQKKPVIYNNVMIIPMRWSNGDGCINTGTMKSKYVYMGLDYNEWRTLTWERDIEKERELKHKVCKDEDYIVVNKFWHHTNQKANFKYTVPDGCDIVEMTPTKGYTMLDWGMILEGAREIHTVGTSLIYMLEIMKLSAYIYMRPNEKDYNNYNYLLKGKYNYDI